MTVARQRYVEEHFGYDVFRFSRYEATLSANGTDKDNQNIRTCYEQNIQHKKPSSEKRLPLD